MMTQGLDLTGKATMAGLFGNLSIPIEAVVVADDSLAEMYGMRADATSFHKLKHNIATGLQSGDPQQCHLALLLVRDSESGRPGTFLGEFLILTKELWKEFEGGSTMTIPDHWHRGVMVGETINEFARFFANADVVLLTRLQDVASVGLLRRMKIVPGGKNRIIPSSQAVLARLFDLVLQRWPKYKVENDQAYRNAKANQELSVEEMIALSRELWQITHGKKTLGR